MNQSQSQGRLLLSVKQLSHMTCVIILQHFFSVENPAFKHIQDQIPTHESLKDLIVRIQPFWQSTILPSIQNGERILIVAHGTSLR